MLALTAWAGGASVFAGPLPSLCVAGAALVVHWFTRRRARAASVAGWVYELPLAEDITMNGRALANAGDPGYIGKSKRQHPLERWLDDNHPMQQPWGRKHLDAAHATVYPCSTVEEMNRLESTLIAIRVKQGILLFNERGVPGDRRLPRWEDFGRVADGAGRVAEEPSEVSDVFLDAPSDRVRLDLGGVSGLPVERLEASSRY